MDGGPDAGCRLHGELRGQEIFYDALLPFLGEPSQSIAWTAPPSHMAAAIPRSWVPRSDPADSEPDFGGGEGYLIPFYNQATLLFVALAAISYLLLLVCVRCVSPGLVGHYSPPARSSFRALGFQGWQWKPGLFEATQWPPRVGLGRGCSRRVSSCFFF